MPTEKLIIGLFLCLSWCETSLQYSARPRSHLCVKSNAPCSSDGLCTMFYFPVNSSHCGDLPFTSVKTSITQLTLGSVRINTYLYEDRSYSQTAFNLTFADIKWTTMKFRIMQNGNRGKNTCRQFTRTEDSSPSTIAYDCIWSDEGYEGKPFIFDYQAETNEKTEAARVVFNVPLTPESKDESRLLTYVEAIPLGLARTQFHLFWPQLPEKMQVKFYRVYVFFNDSGTESVLHTSKVDHCKANLCFFDTHKWFGEISFGVVPVFENDVEGTISRTQYFDLGELDNTVVKKIFFFYCDDFFLFLVSGPDRVSPLLLTLVFCSIFVPIILYSALLLRKRIIRKSARTVPPKILVIHSPTTTSHLRVTEAFVNYLNTYCQVIALMDELDIPRSASRVSGFQLTLSF